MGYLTNGDNVVTPLPLAVGDEILFDADAYPWTVAAVTTHFAAATRPVTDRDRDEIYAEYDVPDDCDGDGCDHLGCHSDPPNLERFTVFYTVIDWRHGVRGPCNLIGQSWGDGTDTPAECAAMLAQFESGELEVSHRNRLDLDIREHRAESSSARPTH